MMWPVWLAFSNLGPRFTQTSVWCFGPQPYSLLQTLGLACLSMLHLPLALPSSMYIQYIEEGRAWCTSFWKLIYLILHMHHAILFPTQLLSFMDNRQTLVFSLSNLVCYSMFSWEIALTFYPNDYIGSERLSPNGNIATENTTLTKKKCIIVVCGPIVQITSPCLSWWTHKKWGDIFSYIYSDKKAFQRLYLFPTVKKTSEVLLGLSLPTVATILKI